MTIKDVSLRVGITHQAVRSKIAKETGKSSSAYTKKDGELTAEGLQLIADLYFDGDLDALNNSVPIEPSCDNQADNTNQAILRLTQDNETLTLEVARLSQEVASLVSERDNLRTENQSLRQSLAEQTQQIVNLTTAFSANLSDAHRLVDQAQQLQLASIQQHRPLWRRLLGK